MRVGIQYAAAAAVWGLAACASPQGARNSEVLFSPEGQYIELSKKSLQPVIVTPLAAEVAQNIVYTIDDAELWFDLEAEDYGYAKWPVNTMARSSAVENFFTIFFSDVFGSEGGELYALAQKVRQDHKEADFKALYAATRHSPAIHDFYTDDKLRRDIMDVIAEHGADYPDDIQERMDEVIPRFRDALIYINYKSLLTMGLNYKNGRELRDISNTQAMIISIILEQSGVKIPALIPDPEPV